jgi:aldehyde dehydrogenase (NAD+)
VAGLRASFNAGATRSSAWRRKTLLAFQRMMREKRGEMCAALKADLNKSPAQAWMTELNLVEADIQMALDHLEEWMQPKAVGTDIFNLLGGGRSEIHKDPKGVVCLYGAWNYPFILTLQPLVGIIAAGNCALVKTSSPKYSKHSAECMLRLCNEYFDNDTIRFIGGDRYVTQALFKQRFDHCFLTGSPANGKRLAKACAEFMTPCTLELGGKSPCIVGKACSNMGLAARRATWGSLLNSGQTCIRPDYNLVHVDRKDDFLRETLAAIKDFQHGDRASEFYGRVVNCRAWDRLTALIAAEKSAGRVVRGGESMDRDDRYIEPTVVDFGEDWEAFKASPIMEDEVFGPIIPIVAYRELDECLEFINANEKPLVVHVFTGDQAVADRVLRETSSGSAAINDAMTWMNNHDLPFGGVGNSGSGGAYHGESSFNLFSHHKSVMRKSLFLDLAVPYRFPPYNLFGGMTITGVLLRPYSALQKKLFKWVMMVLLYLVAKRFGFVEVLRDGVVSLLNML